MSVTSCIPVIPSADLERSLRFWVEGLRFKVTEEMRDGSALTLCMLRKGDMWFMLNRRTGTLDKPADYNGIRLYWAPKNIRKTRERLQKLGFAVSELDERDYGQTEFVLTDDDGFSHCFGVATDT